MTGLWTSPLGPVAWLVLAALVLLAAGRYLPARLRSLAPVASVAAALAAWLALRLQPEYPPRLWTWRTALGLDTAIGLQMEGWGWLAGLMILLVAFVALALPGWRWRPGFVDPRHWSLLVAASALLVVQSSTWIALFLAWTLQGFFAGLVAGSAGLGASRAWSLAILSTLFLYLAALFNGGAALELPLSGLALNVQAQLFLVLAAVIPLGFYPFHLWLSPEAPRSPGRQLAVHLLPGLAALHLLGQLELPLLATQAWVLLAVVSLLGSALAAWADQDDRRRSVFVYVNRSSWAVLALSLSALSPPGGAIFPLIGLALGAALWAIARVTQWHYGWMLPFWLAVATLYGLPATPGFGPTLDLSQLAGTVFGLPAWLLVLLAQALLLAALLQRRQPPPEEPETPSLRAPRLVIVALALTAGLTLWWGVAPAGIVRLIGLPVEGAPATLADQLRGAALAGWLTLVAPAVLALVLVRADRRFFGNLRGWQDNVARVSALGWLFGLAGRVFHTIAMALGFLADLVDGAGQFGWVLLAVLLATILLSS